MLEIKKQTYILIGIGNHPVPRWEDYVLNLVRGHRFFSGGKRHYELVKPFLPSNYQWIMIEGKMDAVIAKYNKVSEPVVVFASGDPFFYGFGNTIKRLSPEAVIHSYPYFSSIQCLCHKTQTNYSKLKTISLHGRDWIELDKELIQNQSLIGLLTDDNHSPQKIAQRLLDYNYDHYQMIIGEELDGVNEKITELSLATAAGYKAQKLNCVILKKIKKRNVKKNVPDHEYQTLEGRPGMITKLPIRLVSLQALALEDANEFWDIGSCTGAIAIEAKLNYPQLNCFAFEKRTVCDQIIDNNAKKHQALGINIEIGDFFDQDLSIYKSPQSVFIGGHGNRLEELIDRVDEFIAPDGVVVMNTVLEKSFEVFQSRFKNKNYNLSTPVQLRVDDHNTILVLVAKKKLDNE